MSTPATAALTAGPDGGQMSTPAATTVPDPPEATAAVGRTVSA